MAFPEFAFGEPQSPVQKSRSRAIPAAKSQQAPVSANAPRPTAPVESVTARIRKRRRRRPSGLLIGGIIAAVVLGSAAGVFLVRRSGPVTAAPSGKAPLQENPAWVEQQRQLVTTNEDAAALSPTDGEPIPLNFFPFTPHLIFHVRPAELWKNDRQMNEFTATLSDLGIWLRQLIPAMTAFEAEEIAELTVGINFGARTSAPEVAAVVRLREVQQGGDLFRRLKGSIRTDLDANIVESGEWSYLIIDNQTFAVAPLSLSDALAAAKQYPADVPPDLEPLVRESDRNRLLTLLFDVRTIDIHREYVLIPPLQSIADQFVVWLGSGVETVSWSLHLQPHFFMETLLHHSNDSSPLKLQRSIQTQLNRLPDELLTAVRKMQPQSQGARQIIGRFPAMIKALQLGTTASSSPQFVRLVTILPASAAGNLAAGTLLTWNQSLLTDFSPVAESTAETTIPDRIADRLKMQVLIDFRNFPLQEAMAYIGEEIRTEIIIDGDALKAAGFTQNMNQTFNLGSVPAIKAFDAILAQYAGERDPMVIVVDEAAKKIILGTRSKAELDGLTIFNTKQ